MGAGVWLLDLTVGGRVYRYASRAVTVRSSLQGELEYRAGLPDDLEVELDGLEEEQGIEVIDRGVDWARLAARGNPIDRQPATLRFWTEGLTLERARVIADGVVAEPEYGDPDRPGALVLTVRARPAGSLYPPAAAVIDDTTWPNDGIELFDPLVEGAVYPTVFGYPGWLTTVSGNEYARLATPAIMAHADTGFLLDVGLLLSIGAVAATSVRVYDIDLTDDSGAIPVTGTAELDVVTDADLLGQVVSLTANWPVPSGSPNDFIPALGHRYYASWRPPDSGSWGAGIVRGASTTIVRSLTELALWAMRTTGRSDTDPQAQEAQRDALDQFQVDGFINERIEPVEWFETELGSLFPVVRNRSPRGIYWRFINWAATAVDATTHLDADSGRARRASSIRTYRDQVANRFTLEYGFVLDTGTYAARRVLAAVNEEVTLVGGRTAVDERVVGSPLLARSVADYGEIEADTIRSQFVWDQATALLILHHRAIRDALPRRTVSYVAQGLQGVQRGDVVTVSDDEVGLDNAVALVDRVALSATRRHRVDLQILDPAFRSTA